MFTRLFSSADFGDKERRLIFEEAQNAPEQNYADMPEVKEMLGNLEASLDSPDKAEQMAKLRADLATTDGNKAKQIVEAALASMAVTAFPELVKKYKGDETLALQELRADFRSLGVVVTGRNPDGSFTVSVYVKGADNTGEKNAPAGTPKNGAGEQSNDPQKTPANAPKELPADVPVEKIKDLPQDAQDWIQEVYKNMPPYQKGVLLEYIGTQEGRAVIVGLGEKTGKFNPEIVRALAALSGDALKDPSKIKNQGLQDLVKSLTPAERTLLGKLMNFKETPEKGKLTEAQKKQIENDGQGIMREYQKILAENPNPTKQQQEQFLAKLQMKGCDVTNEKALLAGDASAIKALDGAGWERTMNQVMGLFRYLSTAITAVKEKISGKKSEAGTDKPAEAVADPQKICFDKGSKILKDAGEVQSGTLFSFNRDKGILPKEGDNENFPVFRSMNGVWEMKLNAGGPDWAAVGEAKLPGMPANLTEEQKQTYQKWERVRVELGKLNEEFEKAKAAVKAAPATGKEAPKDGEKAKVSPEQIQSLQEKLGVLVEEGKKLPESDIGMSFVMSKFAEVKFSQGETGVKVEHPNKDDRDFLASWMAMDKADLDNLSIEALQNKFDEIQKDINDEKASEVAKSDIIKSAKIEDDKTSALLKDVLDAGGKDDWVRVDINGKQDRFEYKVVVEGDWALLQRQLPGVEQSKWQYSAPENKWRPLS